MKNGWKRLVSASLALVLAGSLTLPVRAEEPAEVTVSPTEDSATPLSVTVGEYVPTKAGSENIQAGGTYTLLALPASIAEDEGDENVATLTPAELLSASGQALFMGSAVADADGHVAFQDVRLRTAEAVVYYVTGPGLATPLYEATSTSTYASGRILTDTPNDHSATVALVDAVTGYRYGDAVLADKDGNYLFESLAPGTYNLLVSKPGYLPTTRTAVTIPDGQTTLINPFNLSSNPYTPPSQSPIAGLGRIGDVNNDGVRDMADLAALLLYFGRYDAPAGITADLSGDGAVTKADTDLLINAATKFKDLTTGTDATVTGAKVTVSDSGAGATAASRYLSVAVDTTSTVSAAALSITFPLDVVQPLNAKGGLVSPTDGGTAASCLVPAAGFTAQMTRWKVEGNAVTLTFALTSDTPKASGEIAKIYYRPVSGSTAGFYDGVFALDHAAALVGRDTVVTDQSLTYPGSDATAVTSITVDQAPTTLTIPSVGGTTVLPLTASGVDAAGGSHPELSGVTWTVTAEHGTDAVGVSVERGLLTVTDQALPGQITVTASRDGVTSPGVVITLENARSVASALTIQRDGETLDADAIGLTAGTAGAAGYTALVLDQYGQPMADQLQIDWALAGAPTGVSVADGRVTFAADVPAGSYDFRLLAHADGLQAAVDVTLTVTPTLSALLVSGAQSAVIPGEGAQPLTLNYAVTALDGQGMAMALSDDLEPDFSVEPADQGVDAGRNPLSGKYEVTVSDQATAGEYTLTAHSGAVSGTLRLTLMAPESPKAVRAAMFQDGQNVESAQLSLSAGTAKALRFTAQLLDGDGAVADVQPERWRWSMSESVAGISLPSGGTEGTLSLAATLKVGSYTFDLEAADAESGLSVTLPVTVTVTPVLKSLTLQLPERLIIPNQGEAAYTPVVTASDADGQPMALPKDLRWTLAAKSSATAPAGVSLDNGILTVSSAAAPGVLTLTAASGSVKAETEVTLVASGTPSTAILVLYRTVTVNGKTLVEQGPAPDSGDTLDVKEGQSVVISYTPMLVNQTTGLVTPVRAQDVKWMGGNGSFTVDANAESGAYRSSLTAIYNNQAASASAAVTVYPNITGLLLDFGKGTATPHKLAVSGQGTRYYPATVMAQIIRFGQKETVPLASLNLGDYTLSMATALTGLYSETDYATGVMTFAVDPQAVQNPTSKPTDGSSDIRYILLYLDYFPGETLTSESLPLYLEPEKSAVTSAVLRQGVGTGTSFAFGTPKTGEVITAAAGTLSNCYALELKDQFGANVTGKEVKWTLDGSPKDGSRYLITLVEPGSAIDKAYPAYTSIQRLRLAPDTPAGNYALTLTAKCGDFTCSVPVRLAVSAAPTPEELDMTVTGNGSVIIPMYYAEYNKSTLNTAVNTALYTAVLRTTSGGELDLQNGYSLSWSVTDANGATPTGVSVSPSGNASALLRVDRSAEPTGTAESGKLRLTAVLRDSAGAQLATGSLPVELTRSASIPTLMTLYKEGSATAITSDSIPTSSTDSTTRTYSFKLKDQYNEDASLRDRKSVKWSLSGTPSGVTLTTVTDSEGVPQAKLTVTGTVNQTLTLTATVKVLDETVPGYWVDVKASVRLTLGTGSSSLGGNGGGGGGGGGGDTTPTDSTPYSLSITGNDYVNTTYGKAVSQSYNFTLRDRSGKTCSLSEQNKVTWSASGLGSGIAFNTSTRTLTVPATTPAGVYKISITARYSSSVRDTRTVTVNVSNPDAGTPTSIAISGSGSVVTTQGTAITKIWSATLKDANNNIVTVGQGKVIWTLSPQTNGTVKVTFDPNTATLTVPRDSGAGTLSCTLTATYGTLKATLVVTVTVNATAQELPTSSQTIMPTLTTSGSSGTTTLTATQEKTIADYSAVGGIVTIQPTGDSNLTSTTVNLSASTVKSMAGQRSQSLRFKTSLGTVTLPPQALSTLAGQGGSQVSITISKTDSALNVIFSCGYESASLPGAITLSAPTTGNVVIRTDAGGSRSVMKKAVVKSGNIVAYLSGSAHLTTETRSPSFSDTQSHWAKEAVTFTAARELFQGTTDTTFSPNDDMTRSMVVTVLHRLEDTPAAGAVSFADVPASQWYTQAVAWANENSIVNGTGNGAFKPGDPVTREQLAKILYEYVRFLGLATNQRNNLSTFPDRASVSPWASDAMQWAVGAGLIGGTGDGRLNPGGNASRAEVSTILQRLITNVLTPAV